ncbi:brct domain-containing DNA repair protein-related [Citrus sinensis]|uniref:Brct domain-containing DNA repair protein-related n=1 Tax=Citrus sinensis TaxID=2711 RepID=A0ACB8P4F6_CITSI|nr:brct domain-containing DNA repair protein-related [Citrus sinensis]
MGGGGGRVEVVSSKGCSRLFLGSVPSLRRLRGGVQSFESMSPASSSLASDSVLPSNAPFSGLVICVTGLSKEARKQVMEATERLGGHFGGRKFEHALKHGSRNGLYIVTLGWFVDSVRRNVRLSESLYTVKSIDEHGMHLDKLNRLVGFAGTENSCLPAGIYEAKQFNATGKHERDSNRSMNSTLSGCSMYVDSDVSEELRNKVEFWVFCQNNLINFGSENRGHLALVLAVNQSHTLISCVNVFEAATNEGATLVNQWFVGCGASYVVCEEDSVQKYMGHSNNLVTPVWVLKTAKEKHVQRLVHISADLARQVGMMLENIQNGIARETCQTPIRPLTPSSLLDSICWSISEPTSTASIYTDSFSGEDVNEHHPSVFFDAEADGKDSEASFANLTRMLTESEKSELIFKNHYLTILFPVDRFAEMGPSSRTYFSDNGFTCLQVLDYIYEFYQESMSAHEVESAIHTDSRHSDRLRAAYASKETAECGYVTFRRIEFLGSCKSFEMLKRVSGDNNSNVYELLLRA